MDRVVEDLMNELPIELRGRVGFPFVLPKDLDSEVRNKLHRNCGKVLQNLVVLVTRGRI